MLIKIETVMCIMVSVMHKTFKKHIRFYMHSWNHARRQIFKKKQTIEKHKVL